MPDHFFMGDTRDAAVTETLCTRVWSHTHTFLQRLPRQHSDGRITDGGDFVFVGEQSGRNAPFIDTMPNAIFFLPR